MPEELQEMKVTNDQLEKIARLIVGIAAVPEFSNKKIPTLWLRKYMGNQNLG